MILSIHQPNFMPWYPFFQKIQSSDIFILLCHCQFEKNGYQNRFHIDKDWYTMSVKRGLDSIIEKEYVDANADWLKIKSKLPRYNDILSLFDECIEQNLSNTNCMIIEKITEMLSILTKIEYDYPSNLKSTERLVDICKKYNADTYLAGIGSKAYLDISKFEKENIRVIFQETKDEDKKTVLEVLNHV